MLVKFEIKDEGGLIYVNPFHVQDLTECYEDDVTQITFTSGGSEMEVKGSIKTVAEKLNREAERTLTLLGIGNVENLTIN